MIKYCTNSEEIINLWQEAFGDSTEEIEFFINNIRHAECVGCYYNDELVSMLYLVDCNIKYYAAKYIYAACTKKAQSGKGYMTELIDYCKQVYSCICLIPANDSLVDFYNKRGFNGEIEIEHLSFDEKDEICEYLLEGYSLTKPRVMIYERS